MYYQEKIRSLEPTTIAIFQPEFAEFGGQERIILDLVEYLDKIGKRSVVVCYYDHINLGAFTHLKLQVIRLAPSPNPICKIRSLKTFLRLLNRLGHPLPLLVNIQSAYHAGLTGRSDYNLWIADTYSLLSEPPRHVNLAKRLMAATLERVRHLCTRSGIRRARFFTTNAFALQREMAELYGREGKVLYLGTNKKTLRLDNQRPPRPIQLLSVSRLQSSKRVDWILKALSLTPNIVDWRLHIVGKGPEGDHLRQLSSKLGIAGNVTFHGFVPDEQLDQMYRDSHIFLMPARQGYGLPALEALQYGCTVLMTSESGVVEILRDNPWIQVTEPDQASYSIGLTDLLTRVSHSNLLNHPLPMIPSQQQWSEDIVQCCGW